jgi:hypothetical protein
MQKRFVFFPLLLAFMGFLTFLRTAGSDHVRAVQIVALIATGMCLGVALAHLGVLFGAKSQR